MKKARQIIYIVLFIVIIGTGTIINMPNFYESVTKNIKSEKYEAWSILIGLDYNENFFDKYFFVNANGLCHKILGQRTIKDVVKTDAGKLVVPVEEVQVWQQAEKTKELYAWLREEGIPFAYIQVPYEICKYDSQLPVGISDYSNTNADCFLQLLAQNNVPYYDLREDMHSANMEHYDSFFLTDHHWTIETAFWAFGQIVHYVETILEVEVPQEYTAMDSFYLERWDEPVLGSNGRKTGVAYAGLDSISLIYPKDDMQMSFSAPEEGVFREGSFQEAYMVYERLQGDNLYEMAQYDVYIGKDYPTTMQRYELAPCDKKILLIKDSYTRPVQAFLGTVFTQVNTIDMRYYEGDVQEYIQELQPDIVLLCYNPYMLTGYSNFNFVQ